MVTLYKKHANSVGTWSISANGPLLRVAHATTIGGSEVVHREIVETNQSGRNIDAQVRLRINSRISRMLDKGYKYTVEEALASQANQLGLERPMLAQKHHEVSNINYNSAVLQKKIDGHRCLITREDGEVIAYSRQGKYIPSIKHIFASLKDVIPAGVTLDGELYVHGVKLQTIGSWIKREQADTARLKFVCYDMIADEVYRERHAELSSIIKEVGNQSVIALPYQDYVDQESTAAYFRTVRNQGFEGLMLRTNDRGYECGKRSRSLLKIKEWEEEEFEVIGFSQSKTGWAICRCKTMEGRIFDCAAPGSHSEKQAVWDNQDEFIGRKLTIEFAHWTDDRIPFQPNAIRWRDDI